MEDVINLEKVLRMYSGILDYTKIDSDNIPEIDLYMDQVIQLFENYLKDGKRYEEDKILTKTMINNYTKDKIIMPVNNKKYSKNHILLLLLVYEMKQTISIGDIKKLFSPLINGDSSDSLTGKIPAIYDKYKEMAEAQKENEMNMLKGVLNDIEEAFPENDESNYEKIMVTMLLLINSSNLKKSLVELLIDDLSFLD